MRFGKLIDISFLVSDKNEEDTTDVQLFFVMEGNLSIRIDEEIIMQENEIFLISPGTVYTTRRIDKALVAVFTISTEEVMDLTQAIPLCFGLFMIRGEEPLQRLLRTMLVYHMQMDAIGEIRKAECSCSVLARIFEICYCTGISGASEASASEAERMRRIIGYINANYNTKISLSELADNMYLSVAYLSKYIKKKLGKCFEDYVNEIRLVHAQKDLLNTEYTITQIAMMNGFPSSNAFTRTFRRACKVTPTEYRISFKKERKGADDLNRFKERLELQRYFEKNPFQTEGEEQQTRIHISLETQKTASYGKNLIDTLNIGPCINILDSAVQEHIIFLKDNLQFRYGRIWNPFLKSLNIDVHVGENYNFTKLDRVFDFLIRNRIIPHIAIGMKPERIVKSAGRHYDVEVVTDFSDIETIDEELYVHCIGHFLHHCLRRFGKEEVEKWRYEFMWMPKQGEQKIGEKSLKLFRSFYNRIKSAVPNASVGGFGFNIYDNHYRLEEYLKYWRKETEPDFLSVYLYPYKISLGNFTPPYVNNPEFIGDELRRILALLRQYGYPEEKLIVSEWNSTISDRDYLHDSCYMGAYILKNAIDAIGLTKTFIYYGSTDRIMEYTDTVKTLFGGSGILTRDGIRKPSYYAFQFMKRLGKKIIGKGTNHIATVNEEGEYIIVCHNCVSPRNTTAYPDNTPYDQINYLFPNIQITLEIHMTQVQDGKYMLRCQIINQYSGSVMDELLRIDNTLVTNNEDLDYLHASCLPRRYMEVYQSVNRKIDLQMELAVNEIRLITLSKITE